MGISLNLPKTNKSDNNKIKTEAADLSGAVNANQNTTTASPWFLFLAALVITAISASAVLFIKLKFHPAKK